MGALLGVMAVGSVLVGVEADRVPTAQAAPAGVEASLSRLTASPPMIVPASAAVSLNHSSSLPASSLAVAAMPAPEPAASPMMRRAAFTWTGNSSDPDDWNEVDNWSGMGGACTFPCSASDDATFSTCNFYVYFDAGRTIDDLTISLNSDQCFNCSDGDGNVRTLTCDTVTILGQNDGVSVVNKAGIVTN